MHATVVLVAIAMVGTMLLMLRATLLRWRALTELVSGIDAAALPSAFAFQWRPELFTRKGQAYRRRAIRTEFAILVFVMGVMLLIMVRGPYAGAAHPHMQSMHSNIQIPLGGLLGAHS
jgi:type IV secretory pathway VirB2 component (pilin)